MDLEIVMPESCGWCGKECGRKFRAERRMVAVLVTNVPQERPDRREVTTLDEVTYFCTDGHREVYCFGP